jgi:hypothetical protein
MAAAQVPGITSKDSSYMECYIEAISTWVICMIFRGLNNLTSLILMRDVTGDLQKTMCLRMLLLLAQISLCCSSGCNEGENAINLK